MWRTLQNKSLSIWALMLITVAGCLVSANCLDENADAGIKEFKKPSAFSSREMNMENIEARMYAATGIMDAIHAKAIAIGELQYTISPGVRISCPVASFVGIKVDDRGDVIACEPVRPR